MTRSKIFKLALVILVVAGIAFWGLSRKSTAAGDAGIGTVARGDLTQRVTISGMLWPRKRLDVKPSFNAYIQKIFVKIGDRVKNHDPLVTFSPSLDKGETNYPVRAAFDGVVTQILKNEGESVTETGEGNLVLRVEDLSDLYVLAASPELDIAKLKIGQEAKIRLSSLPGETFAGKISQIALSAKDKERWSSSSTEFQVRILLSSHDPRLLPGMSALLDVITAKAENVLNLPHEYIQERDGNYFVTRANGDEVKVEVGLQTEDAAEIKSGLSEGDKIRVIDFLSLPKLKD